MKKVACVIFELAKDESVEDVIERFDNNSAATAVSKACPTNTWETKLKEILGQLSIGYEYKGYHCVTLMMEALANDPKKRERIFMKELYAYISEKSDITFARADRNIRAMIDAIYKKNSIEDINEILNINSKSERKEKVKPIRFVALLAALIF